MIHDEFMRVVVWGISVSGSPSFGGNFQGRAVMLSGQKSLSRMFAASASSAETTGEQILYQIALISEIYKKTPHVFAPTVLYECYLVAIDVNAAHKEYAPFNGYGTFEYRRWAGRIGSAWLLMVV